MKVAWLLVMVVLIPTVIDSGASITKMAPPLLALLESTENFSRKVAMKMALLVVLVVLLMVMMPVIVMMVTAMVVMVAMMVVRCGDGGDGSDDTVSIT